MSRRPVPLVAHGFTLVEAVIVIVIIGVLGAIVAVFIRAPVQGYADSLDRAELSDTADLALRRIARDLRLALPNSIRVVSSPTVSAIEFIPTKSGGRYLAAEDGVAGLPVLDFANPNNTSFTVVGDMPSGKGAIVGHQDYVVVGNLGPGFSPADAYTTAGATNIARVDSVSGKQITLEGTTSPFGAQNPPMPSESSRFQVVGQPVSYVCTTGANGNMVLSRQWNYGFNPSQVAAPVPPAADTASLTGSQYRLIAGRVATCQFSYTSLATTRSALVILTLELQPRNSTDATVKLVDQVHVDNTP